MDQLRLGINHHTKEQALLVISVFSFNHPFTFQFSVSKQRSASLLS
jgi:hypothetical protein